MHSLLPFTIYYQVMHRLATCDGLENAEVLKGAVWAHHMEALRPLLRMGPDLEAGHALAQLQHDMIRQAQKLFTAECRPEELDKQAWPQLGCQCMQEELARSLAAPSAPAEIQCACLNDSRDTAEWHNQAADVYQGCSTDFLQRVRVAVTAIIASLQAGSSPSFQGLGALSQPLL